MKRRLRWNTSKMVELMLKNIFSAVKLSKNVMPITAVIFETIKKCSTWNISWHHQQGFVMSYLKKVISKNISGV